MTQSKPSEYLERLTDLLVSLGEPRRSAAARDDKKSRLEFLAIPVPILKKVATRDFSLSHLPESQALAVWDHVWQNSPYYEVMAVPLYYYRSRRLRIDPSAFEVIGRWIERVENWGHCDELSYVLSCLTELAPRRLLPYLHKLNASNNTWEVRASIVSTVHYSGKNSVYLPPDEVFSLLRRHVGNRNRYIANSVKWVLREMHRRYPSEVRRFALDHADDLGAAFLRLIGTVAGSARGSSS